MLREWIEPAVAFVWTLPAKPPEIEGAAEEGEVASGAERDDIIQYAVAGSGALTSRPEAICASIYHH